MPKRIDNNKFIHVFIHASAIAFAISLASCGRVEPGAEAGPMPSRTDSSQYNVPESTATAVLVRAAGEPAEVILPTQVEHRHFAIYSAYRVLFDDSPNVFRSRVNGEGLQQAVMSDDDISGLPGCSIRAVLVQD